jgi:hypothetical protein
MTNIEAINPEDDEFAHLIDEIIYLAEQPQNDKFLHALVWPQATINAVRIHLLKSNNEDLLDEKYKKGIKISTSYLVVFSLIQIGVLICLVKPVLDFLTVLISLKFEQWDDFFVRNFNSHTTTGILLIFLLLFIYGRGYQNSIRLTPTFYDYIKQRKDIRIYKLSEELRILKQKFELKEKTQQTLLDVVAQAYNILLAMQTNRASFGKQGKELLEIMDSVMQRLDPDNPLLGSSLHRPIEADHSEDINDHPFQ